ncbi:MAG: diaminopimelate epimerase [Desulfovibrio sp.]|jgi:diaminopimelate epimerase|nr:diaminopimelate epimerase [Desulfovibrio sp.]
MSSQLHFTKMQGTGNDYVYVNGFEEHVPDPSELARRMSDRHFGVGSDGLVLILPSGTADVRMRMFNADGTEAEMCGNASRCVGKYVYDHGIVTKDVLRLETAAGIKVVRLLFEAGEVCGAMVDMGQPEFAPARIPMLLPAEADQVIARPVEVNGEIYDITAVSMGNPHAVVFLENIDALDLPALGPCFENHPLFPQRTNTEFVEVCSSAEIRMRVWERGAGETLACGTGACAAAVASVLNNRTAREVDVGLKGGVLRINWDAGNGHVYMTGGAVTVFDGTYYS